MFSETKRSKQLKRDVLRVSGFIRVVKMNRKGPVGILDF